MNRLSESFNPLAQLRGSGGAPVEGNIRSGKKRGGGGWLPSHFEKPNNGSPRAQSIVGLPLGTAKGKPRAVQLVESPGARRNRARVGGAVIALQSPCSVRG